MNSAAIQLSFEPDFHASTCGVEARASASAISAGSVLLRAYAVRLAAPLLLLAMFGCSESMGRQRPNVLLITIDTLRADHLTAYGHPRRTTPFLEEFAAESIQFADVISQCGTTPQSLSSLMTGLFPYTDDLLRQNGPFVFLKRSTNSLAATLTDSGFRTHAITSSIQSARVTGIDLGFQSFDDIQVLRDVESSRRRLAGEVTELAHDWMAEQQGQPGSFFLWLHYLDPHHPYTPPAEYRERFAEDALAAEGETRHYVFDEEHSKRYPLSDRGLRALQLDYDREVAYTDDALRALFESELSSVLDDSIVILTADHGESLGEHGIITHNELYESIVRVPLLIRLPGGARGGQTIEEPVMLLDVFPTLMSLLGLRPRLPFRGMSLLPAIEGADASALSTRLRLSEYREPAVYSGRFKLIERGDRSELFDLSSDPGERKNLIAALPEHRAAFHRQLAELKARGPGAPPVDPTPLPEVTTEMQRELHALGYVEQ